jgi:protease-4
LAGLYCASLLAAAAVILRGPARNGYPSTPSSKAASLLASARKDAVGWVVVSGAIYQGEGSGPFLRGTPAIARRIKNLSERKDVKAIVLDINSPGGSVGAVQELHSQILRVRKDTKKPVVALFGDVAASGGYYLASACDAIVAHPGTLTGSIGVIFHYSNVEGLFGKIGLKSGVIKSGKMKDIGSMTRPMTEEERALLQGLINDAYSQFLKAVSEGRKIPEADLKDLADGRIFTGRQALDKKLVDEVGDSKTALDLASRLGGIKGKPEVVRGDMDSLSDILEILDSSFSGSPSSEWTILRRLQDQVAFTGLEYRWRP